jgi:hypothetical protein
MTVAAAGLDRRKIGGCAAGRATFAYRLPIRLDSSILSFIQPLGALALPFDQWRVLRLECQGYTVTGIKKMKEVRAVLDKNGSEEDLRPFEEALERWIGAHHGGNGSAATGFPKS